MEIVDVPTNDRSLVGPRGIRQERMIYGEVLTRYFTVSNQTGLYDCATTKNSLFSNIQRAMLTFPPLAVLVVMAAASHLYGLLKAFDYHHATPGVKC